MTFSYSEWSPEPHLQPYVSRFWALEGEARGGSTHCVYPDGSVEMVLHIDEPIRRVAGNGESSLEAAIANYQAGRVPFVTVLEAIATLYDDRATHVRVLASGQAALAALDEASLEPTSDLPAMGAAGAGASMSSSAAPAQPAAMSGMGR